MIKVSVSKAVHKACMHAALDITRITATCLTDIGFVVPGRAAMDLDHSTLAINLRAMLLQHRINVPVEYLLVILARLDFPEVVCVHSIKGKLEKFSHLGY